MSCNGQGHPHRPRIEVRQSSATPEEAAAITAGIEEFLRDTAPAPSYPAPGISPWQRAALFEGVTVDLALTSRWGAPEPWGRARLALD